MPLRVSLRQLLFFFFAASHVFLVLPSHSPILLRTFNFRENQTSLTICVKGGSLDEAIGLLKAHGIKSVISDERFPGMPITAAFKGELRDVQRTPASEILKHDIGVLSAPTAFGKNAIAAYLIAERKTSTLVLVHRRLLMDQ